MVQQTEDYKQELISILFAQKHLIFWAAFLIFVGAVLIAFYQPPTYSASGAILLTGKQLTDKSTEAAIKGSQPSLRVFEVKKEDLASEVQILTSPEVIGKALQQLRDKHPELVAPAKGEGQSDPVHRILKRLSTVLVPASNVIDVHFTDRDPALAVAVLSAIMDEYISYRSKFFSKESPSPAFFGDQAESFNQAIRLKEDELAGLVDSTGISDPVTEMSENIKLKKKLEESLSVLRNSQTNARLTLEEIEKALATRDIQYFSFIENSVMGQIGLQVAALQNERGNILRVYQPTSDRITAVDEQIQERMGALRGEVAAYREDARRKLRVLDQQIRQVELEIAGYDDRNVSLEKQRIESGRIQRDSQVLAASFQEYSKRRDEVKINSLFGHDEPLSSASIMKRAFPSDGPVFPRKGVVIPLGLLVGLLVGCSLGFVREYFDHTFKKPSDVMAYTGLPVIFSIGRPENRAFSRAYALAITALVTGLLLFLLLKLKAGV